MPYRLLLTILIATFLLVACREPVQGSTEQPGDIAAGPACPALSSPLAVQVPVEGSALTGNLYLAPGSAALPTIAWFHGFPGLPEPTAELVAAITGAGMNLLYLHYRGAWGSPGEFGLANAREDAAAAVAFLRSPDAPHACRVDGAAIIPVGDSFGSWIALQLAAADPSLPCAAGALVVDLGTLGSAAEDPAVRAGFRDMFAAVDADEALGFQLAGGADGLMDAIVAGSAGNALAQLAAPLATRPLLLVGAEADQLAPPDLHLAPFAAALDQAGAGNVTVRMFPGGHELTDATYAATLVDWVRNACVGQRQLQ